MGKMAAKLKKLLKEPGIIVVPGTFNALMGRVAELSGFPAIYMPGSMTGATTCIIEMHVTPAEWANLARMTTLVCNIPLIADGKEAGSGGSYTYRAVKLYEDAGIAAMHIEDEIYPKKMAYFAGVNTIVPLEEQVKKIKIAVEAREEMLIIARCDALVAGESMDDLIRREKAYIDAGADIAMPLTLDPEFMKKFTKEIDAPILATGNVWKGQELSMKELEKMGFKICVFPTDFMAAAFGGPGIFPVLQNLKKTGKTGLDIKIRQEWGPGSGLVKEACYLPKFWKMEM